MKRVFANIGFSFALTLIVLNLISINGTLVVLCAASVLLILSLFVEKIRKAVAIPLSLFSVILACLLFSTFYYGSYLPQENLNNKMLDAEFYIVDLEEQTNYGYRYTIKTNKINCDGVQNIKLILDSKEKIDASFYQNIDGRIEVEKIADNGFNSYGKFGENIFLKAKLIKYQTKNSYVKSLNKYILDLRVKIKKLFLRNMSTNSAGMALALVTGDKSGLSQKIKDDFRICGVSHLMAVSGLHLSVVCFSFYWLLKKLRLGKKFRVVLTLLSVVFYMALSSFSHSITRAGIMMFVLLLSKLFSEKSDSLNSLGFAVFLMCFNPFAVTDVGAILTVTAVLGLITIGSKISNMCHIKNKILHYIANVFITSFSVFIITLPITFYFFGNISLLGMVCNLFLIPIAEIVLVLSFLVIIFSFCSPLLVLFSSLCNFFSSVLIYLVSLFAKLSNLYININSTFVCILISAVFIVFGLAFIFKNKNTLKIASVISIILSFVVLLSSYILNFNNIYVREICGYNDNAVVVYDKNYISIFGVSDSKEYYEVKNIVDSKKLNVALIVDTNNSSYSKDLTWNFDVLNYVVKNYQDFSDINCDNIVKTNNFNVDLGNDIIVKYQMDNKVDKIEILVYNTYFNYDFKSKRNNDFDVLYTVNKNGVTDRRLSQWQK